MIHFTLFRYHTVWHPVGGAKTTFVAFWPNSEVTVIASEAL